MSWCPLIVRLDKYYQMKVNQPKRHHAEFLVPSQDFIYYTVLYIKLIPYHLLHGVSSAFLSMTELNLKAAQ